ncbi:hypothetical protein LIER_30287 [Lithospermum erythrorhizon]|uniref:CCHC-type domain-containing protein n=1 Tax=Lithospermum erythrorhizon TaxID=34254 RepID=A0AAV3RQP7_LITER
MIQFQTGDEVATRYLAYERLPNMCFKCGLLGHLIRQCPELEEGSDPKKACVYNLWIKAPLEKSWIMFRLNDEPVDYQPRRLRERQSEPYPITHVGKRGVGQVATNLEMGTHFVGTNVMVPINEAHNQPSNSNEDIDNVTIQDQRKQGAEIQHKLVGLITLRKEGEFNSRMVQKGREIFKQSVIKSINDTPNRGESFPHFGNSLYQEDESFGRADEEQHNEFFKDPQSRDPAIIEIGGIPITQTEETVGLADDKDTRLVHTLAYSGGAITMRGMEELLELGMEEDTHKGGKKKMRFSLMEWNT